MAQELVFADIKNPFSLVHLKREVKKLLRLKLSMSTLGAAKNVSNQSVLVP